MMVQVFYCKQQLSEIRAAQLVPQGVRCSAFRSIYSTAAYVHHRS